MMHQPLSIITIIAVTFLLAGAVKGMIGLGLPTIAMGMLGLVMPPAEAASLLIVPSFVTNVWQLANGPGFGPLLERLWPMMAGVCLGTWVGAGFLAGGSSGFATTALGIALVLYAILGLSSMRLRVSPRAEPWMAPSVGLATGLVTAATGVFVLPAVPYLQALALEKEELVQALGLSFTVSTVALAAGLAQHGVFAGPLMGVSLLALAPALAGMMVGQWLRHRVRQATFRRCFFLGLLALGVHLASQTMV
ncbi:sulfite exporter TauE/SafE family protein [Azospirillum doebereinerae]|uniref:Probable membrane transporter protein n=1 Tax=Azospirillum doebereinerae TaxID=92933 RepID=A0A3S0V3R1_9PROT|nr:sulfite exporter TauE/SafE family protein [Azospirillum doebereinerae]MCG5239055.1 sulfite exporter TauE/SafE family protein [Azospirillum doebereinerae]RUQ75745.1 sulfite exporter TauE/SafE family protein [Azospirillum doebereinerae]